MAQAKNREAWDMLSALRSDIHNAFAKQAKPPSAFNPTRKKQSGGINWTGVQKAFGG